VEGDIAHAQNLGLGDVGSTGITAITGDLAWRLAVVGDVALQHGQKALGIAGLDDDVEYQAAATGRQIDLVPYCTSRPPLTMMSACGSNRLTTFSLAGTTSPSNTRRLVCVMTRSIKGR
jgi:hypothetical protein